VNEEVSRDMTGDMSSVASSAGVECVFSSY